MTSTTLQKTNGLKTSDSFAVLNKIVENEEDCDQLRHFLTDIEMENRHHKVFNFQLCKQEANLVNKKTG